MTPTDERDDVIELDFCMAQTLAEIITDHYELMDYSVRELRKSSPRNVRIAHDGDHVLVILPSHKYGVADRLIAIDAEWFAAAPADVVLTHCLRRLDWSPFDLRAA